MECGTEMVKKLNYILSGKHKIQVMVLFVMILIGAGLELIGVSAILPLAEVILNPMILEVDGIYRTVAKYLAITTHQDFCIVLCIALILIYVVKNVYLSLLTYAQIRFSSSCRCYTTCRMFRAYIHQEYLFHTNHNVANLQRDMITDVERGFHVFLAYLRLMTELITILILGIFLFCVNIMTALFMGGMVGVLFLLFAKKLKGIQVRMGQIQRSAAGERTKTFLQAFAGIKEIHVMDKEDFFCEQYEYVSRQEVTAARKLEFITRFPRYVTETIIMVAMLSIVAIQVATSADITGFISVLSVYAIAAIRLLPSVNRIIENLNTISGYKAYIDGLYTNMHIVKEYESREAAVPETVEMPFNRDIRVAELSYKYPGAKELLFDRISLTIAKNESVAFIGGSGAGKTTLADIMLGLLPTNTGAVLVDGYDIRRNIQGWHQMIGYVPQTIYLTDDTIRNNVAFGTAQSRNSDAAVWDALEKAQLTEFVKSLPDGLDTVVGDRGVRLSGGQRQRIGIARALYTAPKVLILDEATSALDNDTEKAIMEAIDNFKGKTTLIIIAHRLSTIKNCDKIFEIQNHKILERNKQDVLGS